MKQGLGGCRLLLMLLLLMMLLTMTLLLQVFPSTTLRPCAFQQQSAQDIGSELHHDAHRHQQHKHPSHTNLALFQCSTCSAAEFQLLHLLSILPDTTCEVRGVGCGV